MAGDPRARARGVADAAGEGSLAQRHGRRAGRGEELRPAALRDVSMPPVQAVRGLRPGRPRRGRRADAAARAVHHRPSDRHAERRPASVRRREVSGPRSLLVGLVPVARRTCLRRLRRNGLSRRHVAHLGRGVGADARARARSSRGPATGSVGPRRRGLRARRGSADAGGAPRLSEVGRRAPVQPRAARGWVVPALSRGARGVAPAGDRRRGVRQDEGLRRLAVPRGAGAFDRARPRTTCREGRAGERRSARRGRGGRRAGGGRRSATPQRDRPARRPASDGPDGARVHAPMDAGRRAS